MGIGQQALTDVLNLYRALRGIDLNSLLALYQNCRAGDVYIRITQISVLVDWYVVNHDGLV